MIDYFRGKKVIDILRIQNILPTFALEFDLEKPMDVVSLFVPLFEEKERKARLQIIEIKIFSLRSSVGRANDS